MRSFIVGTAGHIDHGKSALVRALTGTDPDRLKEEKERGITIDLGFAHTEIGPGVTASFIDVPGHERFVRHMLAGAFGIDAVLLVVAADESVMPQTREHFHICRLLGIPRGLVVLTKADLADSDSLALAEIETRELVQGSFLEGGAVVRVSAKTGEGLPVLREALLLLAAEAPERSPAGLLRLPVDRVFTLRGFGTVITGTVTGGVLATGDEVVILPGGQRTRVRGLQVHGQEALRVSAGSRAAVNLAGVEVGELERGDVLAHPGTLSSTAMLDAEVTLLDGAKGLKDQARVRLHLASAEVLARVRVLEGQGLEPGRPTLVQLRLERTAVAVRGDLLVVRSYSPAATLGGARVLDPLPPKRKRSGLERVRLLQAVDLPAGRAAALFVEEAGSRGTSLSEMASRLGLPPSVVASALSPEAGIARVGPEGAIAVARGALEVLGAALLAALHRFHRDQPLRSGMPREELRRRFAERAPLPVLEEALQRLATAGEVTLLPENVSLRAHAVTLTPAEQAAEQALLDRAQGAGLAGIELLAVAGERDDGGRVLDGKVLERVARTLQEAGTLKRVGESFLVHKDVLEGLKRDVRARWSAGQDLDVAGFKELTGLTRKHVIPLLEYLDRERVTRRVGATRTVL